MNLTAAVLFVALQATDGEGSSVDQFLAEQGTANQSIGVVNQRLLSLRDLLLEWELKRLLDPSLDQWPSPTDQRELRRRIIEDWLWIDHARQEPGFVQWATDEALERYLRRIGLGPVHDDPPSKEYVPILLRWAEKRHALDFFIATEPMVKRYSKVRPQDLVDYYKENPDQFRQPARAHWGQAVLLKTIHGEGTLALAEQIRDEVRQGRTLREVTEELAPDSYRDEEGVDLESEALQDEILTFARTAEPGAVSEIFEYQSSVRLYQLLERTDAVEMAFEDVSADIRNTLENRRLQVLAMRFLVTRVMPRAYFEPVELFDEELALYGYGRRGGRPGR